MALTLTMATFCCMLVHVATAARATPLISVADVSVAATKSPCNVDGHAINITNIGSTSVNVTIVGSYQGSTADAGMETFSLEALAAHTTLACTSYGGYVLHVGPSMWNDNVSIHATSSEGTDDWQVSVPQMQPWDPQILRINRRESRV